MRVYAHTTGDLREAFNLSNKEHRKRTLTKNI